MSESYETYCIPVEIFLEGKKADAEAAKQELLEWLGEWYASVWVGEPRGEIEAQ